MTLTGHTGPVNDVAYAPDGSAIATASADGTVRVWNPASGAQEVMLSGHETGVWDLAFSPDGSKLASASPDGTVRVWALDVDDLIEIARSELTRSLRRVPAVPPPGRVPLARSGGSPLPSVSVG